MVDVPRVVIGWSAKPYMAVRSCPSTPKALTREGEWYE